MTRRAVIYARVSSDRKHGRSVAEQEAECRADCERNGWPVAEVVVDNDTGASRWSQGDRSGYRRLADLLSPGDVLVTWEASRMQRDLAAYVDLRELCAERGVLWCYSGRIYDLASGADRFSTGLDALIAEKASEETRERVLRALRHNAAEGIPHGGYPPFGYRPRREHGKLVGYDIEPTEHAMMREAAHRILDGETVYSVAADMRRRGFTTTQGNPWRPNQLLLALTNPVYVGKRAHKGVVVAQGNWEPMLTEAEHRRLVALRHDPRRLTHHGSKPRHLLAGIAVCGVCGQPVRTKHDGRGVSYVCDGHVSRRTDRVNGLVRDVLLYEISTPEFTAALLEPTDRATEYLSEASKLEARLDEHVLLSVHGEITPATLAKVEAELLPEINRLHELAARKPHDDDDLRELVRANDPASAWATWSLDRQRRIIRSAFDIRIHPAVRAGDRTFDPSAIAITWAE